MISNYFIIMVSQERQKVKSVDSVQKGAVIRKVDHDNTS